MERICECPSGMTGRVTHLRAEDAGILADQRAVRSGRAADRILQKCWIETTNPGPYHFSAAGPNWSEVLVCDRVWALLTIRIATYGETEELELRCPDCGHRFVWDLPLLDLPYRALPEDSRAAVAAGKNRFECVLPGGTVVGFKLANGADQVKAVKEVRVGEGDLVVSLLRQRVLDVSGVDPKQLGEWFSDLSMGDVQTLVDAMDAHDGGLDTAFDVYCPNCTVEWEVDLPLDLARMFAPKRATPRRREHRRGALKARPQPKG